MYRLTIKDWINEKTGEYHPERSFNADLVETLLANSPQPVELIFKYYGEQAPASAFRPGMHDRLVFFNNDYGYVIIPNTPFNYDMWAKLDA